ncbi:MAG TPA: radical SAM protein [Terriglobales bacterium]|nr:radical SAM protein [Terriglobales bacterium]
MSLLEEINQRAIDLRVPLSVQLDVTYRCNERCIHCYLDHHDRGEMTTDEIIGVLDQLADAGTFFLTFSGGEVFLRRDFLKLVEHARQLLFNVKIKTNAVLIREAQAEQIRELGVDRVQISVYSHRPEVHDAITHLPGSLERTLRGVRLLTAHGVRVSIANVLMNRNIGDQAGVQELARELGVHYTVDPTITPHMDGDRTILSLRIPSTDLERILHDETLVGDVQEFCAPPAPVGADILDGYPCSAGHTFAYISPYAEVFPCVQFPLPCGNLRQQRFADIWKASQALNQVRSIRARDLEVCSECSHVGTCTRCPGLAYMEGNMRGPSSADCEKSWLRTGIRSANMIRKTEFRPSELVQIRCASPQESSLAS